MLAALRARSPLPAGRRNARTGKSPGVISVLGAILLLASCGGGSASTRCELGGTYPLWVGSGEERVRINVQIADDREERARGLMGRTQLGPDEGMVFLYERATRSGFWMKDTEIPLTIAFWGTDGRLAEIRDMDPCHQEPCPVTVPADDYIGALEVNRGTLERLGITRGDVVALRAPCAS